MVSLRRYHPWSGSTSKSTSGSASGTGRRSQVTPGDVGQLLDSAAREGQRLRGRYPSAAWQPVAWPAVDVSAEALRRAARRSCGRAAGPDGWRAEHLLLLPLRWWSHLSDLVRAAIDHGVVPEIWTRSHTALVRKPKGGYRPITVASLLWRLMSACTIKSAAAWADACCPPEIVGGVSGRGLLDAYAWLWHSMQQTHGGRRTLLALSHDLQKCFDSVDWLQAIAVAGSRGLPEGLQRILLQFYASGERLLCLAWRHPHRGLLQGCPWSPLLLGLLMQIWVTEVSRGLEVRCTVFLDDRCLWTECIDPQQGLRRLEEAERRSDAVDADFGFMLSMPKVQKAANTPEGQQALSVLLPQAAAPGSTLDLLGLRCDLAACTLQLLRDRQDLIAARVDRVAVASRSQAHRRRHIASLVLPILTWCASFAVPPCNQNKALQQRIRRAVVGYAPREASPLLMDLGVLGPELDLEWLVSWLVLRRFVALLGRDAAPQRRRTEAIPEWLVIPAHEAAPRMAEVLERYGWRWQGGCMERDDHYGDCRVFRPGWDSTSVLRAWLTEHWSTSRLHQCSRLVRPQHRLFARPPQAAAGGGAPCYGLGRAAAAAALRCARLLALARDWGGDSVRSAGDVEADAGQRPGCLDGGKATRVAAPRAPAGQRSAPMLVRPP
mmetsp:Transcript_66959/g.216384  ORF Transcript_66959/g.216384 Transcript_66959/m.216384 type:complete len:663 (+) Transcript_66959:2085-4073(+)